jgi:hypothetical protein
MPLRIRQRPNPRPRNGAQPAHEKGPRLLPPLKSASQAARPVPNRPSWASDFAPNRSSFAVRSPAATTVPRVVTLATLLCVQATIARRFGYAIARISLRPPRRRWNRGRELDNEPPKKTAAPSHRLHCRVSLADQWRLRRGAGARRPGLPRLRPSAGAGRGARSAPP